MKTEDELMRMGLPLFFLPFFLSFSYSFLFSDLFPPVQIAASRTLITTGYQHHSLQPTKCSKDDFSDQSGDDLDNIGPGNPNL